jgi:GNAT superfamily N-acetyltransferase
MPASILIRAAATADADVIATLLGQLGYPATQPEVTARLTRLASFPHATVLVAERLGRVVGLATGHVFPSIHVSGLVAWLTTMVVDDQHLHQGVGRQLSAAIEQWARKLGAARISVTSGKQREGAHRFYEHIGYERTGVRLTKTL